MKSKLSQFGRDFPIFSKFIVFVLVLAFIPIGLLIRKELIYNKAVTYVSSGEYDKGLDLLERSPLRYLSSRTLRMVYYKDTKEITQYAKVLKEYEKVKNQGPDDDALDMYDGLNYVCRRLEELTRDDKWYFSYQAKIQYEEIQKARDSYRDEAMKIQQKHTEEVDRLINSLEKKKKAKTSPSPSPSKKSSSSSGSSRKYSSSKKTTPSKKVEMPDCDDYEDYDDFMDDWDGNMPDGSDAEDYWENW